ncbi:MULTISPECIES: META domain-containing protein [unclassified Marinobacter]|uniref:META domain-containing protein n=1 Tax=unclassified Marinobacter TaxID=83889 RepID=UPI0026E295F3|nr:MULTISPECIES: META domain-containing protein [unclassified Marinobacter]MDO6441411.1 META domain-containing protein [Marinobacter sp. 2_MG-2023]MDO6822410.1 META domain-containing protein [Marinobacter sp. 1_MG-2023]
MSFQRILITSVVVTGGLFLSACATGPDTPVVSESYQCGQLDVVTTTLGEGDQLAVDYLGNRLLLNQTVSASGARYQAQDDDETYFWSKGERALFNVKGQSYPECLQAGALELPFEATGNEPFWHVRVAHQQLVLNRLDDTSEPEVIAVETTAANHHGREFRGELDGQELTLKVARQLCEDTMSGSQFPAQVRLELNGEVYEGCGGDPQRLFRGVEWIVEDLAGAGIIDSSRMTVEFLDENRLAGRASCNRYGGQYKLTAEGVSFSSLFSTRMACAPALMNQEQRFLELMADVKQASIGQHGELVLTTSGGEKIKAFQSTENKGNP